ncbi:hypothetical protein ACF1AY_36780 [Streptomyces sp. NPDC014776]
MALRVDTKDSARPDQDGSAPHRPHSLHEWQDFSKRLHDAGHQPYCLVWP